MNIQNFLRLTILLGFLISAGTGWLMWDRYMDQQLWGHLPLLFFASVWVALLGLHLHRRKDRPAHLRWLALALTSGVLLSVGFPPFPGFFTLFFGFVPLFWLTQEINNQTNLRRPIRVISFYAYVAFVTWNLLSTWWVTNTALAAGAVAIFANSGLMLLPYLAFLYFKKYVGERTAYWTFVVFWICFEYGHMRWEITWPWLTLGNGLSTFAWLPQWYSYTGALGGSLWILMSNVFAFFLWRKYRETNTIPARRIVGMSLFVLIPIVISLTMYLRREDKGEARQVLIVQPNYEPHYEKFTVPESDQLARYLRQIRSGMQPETDYVLLPETIMDYVDVQAIDQNQGLALLLEGMEANPKATLITGVSAHEIFERMPADSKNVRISQRGDRPLYWRAYNSALQLDGSLENASVYHKSKLVPGPEIFPYSKYLFFFKPIIDQLDGTIEGLGTQQERSVFRSANGDVAPVICYESVFGEYATGYVQNGARAFFIMTNDGWWDNSAGHLQHLLFGRLRAIENRRSIARAANTGISCFINQRGDILQPTAYDEEATVHGDILLNDETTFYTTWGDIIGRLCLFIGGFQMLYLLFGLLKKRLNIR